MDLFDDGTPGDAPGNRPEFSVSEISGAIKRSIEGEFGHVRVRGEVGRVVLARTGHLYFDLKDDRNVLAAVSWKGQVSKLRHRPEEGMEVIATGRLTTFGPQSKYQLNVEDVEPAGAGALMAMLEKRRAALAAEGLFEPGRKRALPYLPVVIGVVTSPTGAVIRDILHRLRDRFPVKVLIWPVAVQGASSAREVARAIEGFNRFTPGGALPRPDVLIVARGGGSIEDLWGFNEEIVVRAAAASQIPLISAVGHETDTTLIDHAADMRAPTPTAAAEMAVPVRMELIGRTREFGARLDHALAALVDRRKQRLRDLARALPRPERLTETARQRLDRADERLAAALGGLVQRRRARLAELGAQVRPAALARRLADQNRLLAQTSGRLAPAAARLVAQRAERAERLSLRLPGALGALVQRRRLDLAELAGNIRPLALGRRLNDQRQRLGLAQQRLQLRPEAITREVAGLRRDLAGLASRMLGAARVGLDRRADRLAALERLRASVGYEATLRRGYAVVRAGGAVLTTAAAAGAADRLEVEFHDGRVLALPVGADAGGKADRVAEPDKARPETAARSKDKPPGDQGSLF